MRLEVDNNIMQLTVNTSTFRVVITNNSVAFTYILPIYQVYLMEFRLSSDIFLRYLLNKQIIHRDFVVAQKVISAPFAISNIFILDFTLERVALNE
jgi:hypothetical protein